MPVISATPPFCAHCTTYTGPFVQRPLGKNDGLVTICIPCDQEHPREGRYSFGAPASDVKSIGMVRLGSDSRRKGRGQ